MNWCRARYRRSKPCAGMSTAKRDLPIVPGALGYLEEVAGDALELELTVDLRRTQRPPVRSGGAAVG